MLQLGNGLSTGLTSLQQLLHAARPQADQGEFPSGKKSKQGQQDGQRQDLDHGKPLPGELLVILR
jgi:hypothetical protein